MKVLISQEELQAKVDELAAAITADYAGKRPVLICVLKGAIFFIADLARRLSFDLEIEFMAVSSYGHATDSSGVVRILKDLDTDIEGRHVLIVEDIIDSGLTLQYLIRNLGARNPASLAIVDPAVETEPAHRRTGVPVHGIRDPQRVRRGLRSRLRREVPQPALLGGRRRPGVLKHGVPGACPLADASRRGARDPVEDG